jgi:thioredoxin 1
MSVLTVTKDNYETEVKQSDKPVLLDFWAPWCGPCKMIAPIIDEIAAEQQDVRVGKVNVTEEPDLVSEFGIMNIPALMLVKDGQTINELIGANPKEAILQMIQSV